jgi:16S rRNA (adenine1518-N6/adenine1519-N6)-dimethyltransferase
MKQTHRNNKPNKHLGQHFLIDPRIKEKILNHTDIKPSDTVLEIGPGEGALTSELIPLASRVIAVEKDPSLVHTLRGQFTDTSATFIHSDILQMDFTQLPPEMKVIGNLPYNITTPIITKILTHSDKFRAAYFTVQMEFGKRLAAGINTKDYGAFTCFTQYHADVDLLFTISPAAFWPRPKVQSCFLKLTPRKKWKLTPKEEERLFQIIQMAFKQRRKKALNALAPFLKKEEWLKIFLGVGIDREARAENIRLEQYVKMAKTL